MAKITLLFTMLLSGLSVKGQSHFISLNDWGSHGAINQAIIERHTSTPILSWTDSTAAPISSNAYLSAGIAAAEKIYENPHQLFIFSGVNQKEQLNNNFQTNYYKNVLTVTSGESMGITGQPRSLHPKIDLIVPSCATTPSCANSWASGEAVGMVDRFFVAPFIQSRHRYPIAIETKAAILNSKAYNDFIDTIKLKNQVLSTTFYSLKYQEAKKHTIYLDSWMDSVKLTLCYNDRPISNNLADTLLINGEATTSNIYQTTFYKTDKIDLEIINLGDSLYTTYQVAPAYDTLYDSTTIQILSDSTVLLVDKDSLRGYWTYSNQDTIIIFRFGRAWQTGDTIAFNYFSIRTNDTILFHTAGLPDTFLILSRITHQFSHYDTTYTHRENQILYSIAWQDAKEIITLAPNIRLQSEAIDGGIGLSWEGGAAPYKVQTLLYNDWKTIDVVNNSSYYDGCAKPSGNYYRVMDDDGHISNIVQEDCEFDFYFSNPASEYVVVKGYTGQVQLFDIVGNLVLEQNINQYGSVDIRNLARGSYVIRFEGKELSRILVCL